MERPCRLSFVALSVLLLVGAVQGAWTASGAQTVEVKAKEFAFEPREVAVRPGDVAFVVRNLGAIEHNFVIEDAARKTLGEIAIIAPGKTEQLRLVLRAGSYAMVCTLPGHKDAGMSGVLIVGP
jgi:uncharacterized cupredoxin-like copper-binding protein